MGKHPRFFLAASLAAVGLRLWFVFHFPAVVDDSRLYGNIAENWLRHGVYAVTDSGQVVPTLSRLPGYPAFLAAIFAAFGMDNFRAVLLIQVLFDLATCLLIADMARRLFSERSAKAAFLLAAICPFLANYAAAALTECLEIFFTALSLNLALTALPAARARILPAGSVDSGWQSSSPWRWFSCGLAVGGAMLLRPDGGILLAAIGGYLLVRLVSKLRLDDSARADARSIVRAGVLLGLGAALPLIPWTVRNMHTFRRFEPLAPRYANDSDEPVMVGFNRWVKTWMADYVSVEEMYWNVPGDPIDLTRLPDRAFDSEQQRQQTAALVADYNHERDITPELDARFAALAATRVKAAPFRYYVWLPAVRIADMWLRPRTEMLPPDPRWWEFNDEFRPAATVIVLGLLNLLYVGLAIAGCWRGRENFGIGLFVLFLLLRSAFLGTLENPETRYTLECYPVVIILASQLFR